MIGAIGSARNGMLAAARALDATADRISRATATSVPDPAALPTTAPGPEVVGAADELVADLPALLIARALFTANARTARAADEAYRSALDLVRPR